MERTLSSPGIGIGNGISRLKVSKSHRDLFHEHEHKDREGEGAWYRSTKSNLVRYRASAENLKVGYSLYCHRCQADFIVSNKAVV
jgi:hypothetical protein